jgi:hypothetical protein
MAIDFNAEPFYDDFSEDSKFYKILFRPGYAVQARELTQLQTLLQEQIRRHGDHIFKEGSMVIPGQISYDLYLDYVKLTLTGNNSETILKSLVGKEIKTAAGLIAKVVAYSLQEGNDPSTIFVKYQNSLQDTNGDNITTFAVGQTLTPVDGTSGLDVIVADVGLPTGKGCSATVQRGIYYIKNNFVLVSDQTIILDKYTNSPSYRVGLKLSETIVYPEEDETLLDNALGSPNYSAPGAARYFIDLKLTKLSFSAESEMLFGKEGDTDFIDLLRLRNGQVIFKIDRSQYAELEKTLARRTYDESGDYTLSPFGMEVRDFRNNLRGDWASQEKFIKGDLIKVSNGGLGFWYFVAMSDGITGNSRPTFYNDVDFIIDGTVKWEYVLFPLFNRGINTFTAGANEYSLFTLNDHIHLDGLMCIGVEAGKAYVRGYEIEKLATEYVTLQKSRDLPAGSSALATYLGQTSVSASTASESQSKTTSIDLSSGSYIIAKDVMYAPNFISYPSINLYSAEYASASSGTLIGNARVRGIEKHSPTQFKVFLFDINMNAGKNFSEVKSLYTTTAAFKANSVLTDGITTLLNPTNTALIYQLPDYAIKNISEVSYSVVASFVQTAASGSITIAPPIDYTFESVLDDDNYIIVNNVSGEILSPTLSISGRNLVVSGLTTGVSYTAIATIRRSDATNAQSTRVLTDAIEAITTQTIAQAGVINLNKSFVTRIVSVMMSTVATSGTTWNTSPVYSTDITNRYSFDNNQDVSKISTSKIILNPGETAPIGPILIKYEHLQVSGFSPGNMFSVNSYSGIRYDQIPSVAGYSLRDSIDFRPYETSTGSYANRYLPKYGTTASIKYKNYLPRLDNISLTNLGDFVVAQGIPSATPQEPSIPINSMKLAQLSVEPYTFSRDSKLGVIVNSVENKRYTMRDIGKLERRIQDLEYYTSLTLSELETKSMRIVDSSGFERYQNGFLVDSFDGQGIGNTTSEDWNASIDSTKKELRPFFSQKQVSLVADVSQEISGGYKLSGDLVTLPFRETELVSQLKASKTENLNPYALYTWNGIVDINPWSDTWFSTHYRPDIILNDEGQYNAIVAKAEEDGILGTVWNSWQTAFSSARSLGARLENIGAWSQVSNEILNSSNNGGTFWRDRSTFTTEELNFIGVTDGNLSGRQAERAAGSRVLTIETQAVETTSTRSGTRSFIVDRVDSRVLEDRVVDTQIVPYIRPRAVLFNGYGFKPSTRMYGFFDNISIDDYITPATRLEVIPITDYPTEFDVTRNCGSNVVQKERTVPYSEGVQISGTIAVTNNSTAITGSATSFSSQVAVDDILIISDTQRYKIASVNSNTSLTLSSPYTGTLATGISVKVIGPKHTTDEVEIAFNHGEVIKEYVDNVATGRSAIVVGQEVIGTKYYIYVLNERGPSYSTAGTAQLRAEYPVSSDNYEGYVNAYSDLLNYWTTNLQTTMTKAAWGESHWKQTGINERRTLPAFPSVPSRVKFVAQTKFTNAITTGTGQLHGIFRIPSNPSIKFRTGTRELRFSDNASTSTSIRTNQESTSGGAFYEANGLLEIKQRTIVSTRTANIVSEQMSDTNTIVTVSDRLTRDTGWFDPLAQTFMVQQEGGCFITSVDLFFASKDAKVPVRIEIREVVNGYPGSVVLPFSRVEKKPSEVTLSNFASAPTTFNFTSPVFLQNGIEYALVVLSDSNSYTAWISETDTIDVQTGVRIASQPYNGVLFKSQNASAWTADQTQDLKFIIRRAVFSQSAATLKLIPPKLAYKDLAFNPFNFITGSGKCRVNHPNHGMIANEKVMFKSRQVIDSINGIPAAQIFDVEHIILSAELDAYVVEFATTSTATGQAGGGFITATENFEYQTAMLDIADIVPAGTSIEYNVNTINHSDQSASYTLIPRENTDFDEVKVYPAEINYTNVAFPTGLAVTATLNPSPLDSISPVIDLSRIALTMVSNKIDSPVAVDVNDEDLDYFLIADNTTLGASPAPIQTTDLNSDGIIDTLVINASTQATLFTRMNNNLNVGDVLKFDYSGITDGIKYMTIIEKSQDSTGKLYFTLEGVSGETIMNTTSGTVDISWLSHFKSEYAVSGGSTHSKYVTKKINFSRPSEMLKIMFGAMIPTEADVEIYYKTGIGVQGDFITTGYKKAVPKSYTKSSGEFTEVIADVEGLEAFDSVIVKLVMKSINKAKVPRIKNFRVIAIAA